MRMIEYNYSIDYWVDLFNKMYESGITIHHVSSEYHSYKLYLTVLRQYNLCFPERPISHLVKLAEPHFDSTYFDPNRLQKKTEEYLDDLSTSKLWGVQWMWRGKLSDEKSRLIGFHNSIDLIGATIEQLKKNHLAGSFYLFPYTKTFCESVITSLVIKVFDGLIVYRNFNEIEYDEYFDFLPNNIIIRPLGAGKLSVHLTKKQIVEFALSHSKISYGIVSISSIGKLNELIM